jgi:hypothetical protein
MPPGMTITIQTPDQRLRVFVSSTMGELAPERQAVSRAVSALRLTPVLFELGARAHPPRDLYRAYLAQSDVFIGLYWQRYGEIVPGLQMSGLEEEFELSEALPRLLYVKAPAPGRDPRLADLMARIRQEASYRTFGTPAELGRLVRRPGGPAERAVRRRCHVVARHCAAPPGEFPGRSRAAGEHDVAGRAGAGYR